MKLRVAMLIALLAVVSAVTAQAGNYTVYKGTYQVEQYNETSGSIWSSAGKMKFEVYLVVRKDFSTTEAPARIVTLKIKGDKVQPAAYDATTKTWKANSGAKATNKLLVYPYDVKWTAPTGDVSTCIESNYVGTSADDYIVYGGEWDSVSINGTSFSSAKGVKSYLSMVDYYKSSKLPEEAFAGLEELVDVDNLKGFGEFYAGKWTPNKGEVKKLDGAISYYVNGSEDDDGILVISKKASLKYDKKLTEKEIGSSVATMEEAVNEVVDYLVSKKYASTWVE